MDPFLQILITLFTGVATGFSGWFYGRRKTNAEAEATEIGNLDRIAQMWQRTAEQFKESYHDILRQNLEIQERLNTLASENKRLLNEVEDLNCLVKELKSENKELMKNLQDIKLSQQNVNQKN